MGHVPSPPRSRVAEHLIRELERGIRPPTPRAAKQWRLAKLLNSICDGLDIDIDDKEWFSFLITEHLYDSDYAESAFDSQEFRDILGLPDAHE